MKKLIFIVCAFCAWSAQAQHTLPPLPYEKNALEPVMSAETIEYHHGKHVQTYVDNLNKLVPGSKFENATVVEISRDADGSIYDNGAQILNHKLFFETFAPEATAKHMPSGKLAEAIDKEFGSFENFKKEFAKAANNHFGSGWTWLASNDKGKLYIVTYENAGNPIKDAYMPLLGVDVWEHSYYIDYRNRKADYLDNLWRIIDWSVVESRYNG